MIYARPEEIAEVKKNLEIFEDRLKDEFVRSLLKADTIRYQKHGLFFSLLNPVVLPHLKEALIAIKKYSERYFERAIIKLIRTGDWLEHKSVLSEILVVGYYFNKFLKDKNIEVVWERRITDKGGSVDISIIGFKRNINIEVTVLHDDAEYRYFVELRNEIKIALEKMSESFKEQRYGYLFTLPKGSTFKEKDIPTLVDFVTGIRDSKGTGEYLFKLHGKVLVEIKILALNKLKQEYASNIEIFSKWNEDSKRIQDKISEKITKQLPKGEINFVCISALDIWTDDYAAEQAILGSEQVVIDLKTGSGKWTRASDDISLALSKEGYDSFFGLIYFNWDYSKKKIIGNPTKKYEGEVKEVVELIT